MGRACMTTRQSHLCLYLSSSSSSPSYTHPHYSLSLNPHQNLHINEAHHKHKLSSTMNPINTTTTTTSSFSTTTTATTASSSGAKMWEETETDPGGGLDELMAVLGYKVKASDMTGVAQKLQHLEEVMGSGFQNNGFSSDTVYYNPSDLSTWVESMISEHNPGENQGFQAGFGQNQTHRSYNSSSVVIFDDSVFDSDLTAIPGKAIFPPPPSPPPEAATAEMGGGFSSEPPCKRLKQSWGSGNDDSCGSSVDSVSLARVSQSELTQSRPVVLVESEENGVRLVHGLMACAEAVQGENYKVAEALLKQIGILAISQAGSMRKVATYFAQALARRIYKLYPSNNDSAFTDYLQMHFYEACPYLKFAHFTANQAILEAFAGKSMVHIIDFGIKQGMQWPALLQALALRPGGPPSFRLTGIGPPSSDNTDHLQEVGWKLAQLADTIDVKFEYRGYVASSLADLDASMFNVREGETVAVNSIFELHQMLARPGAIDKVLSVVRDLKPSIFTVVEQEANHNGPLFLDRFTESLHYYSTLFDSLEGGGGALDDSEVEVAGGCGGGGVTEQDKVMTEVYLGRQICNVVACEGIDRVERHETLAQWRTRFELSEFEPVHLGSNAFKQASMLLALFSGDGYRVEENNGCLLLGWHTRPLISTSAWKLK